MFHDYVTGLAEAYLLDTTTLPQTVAPMTRLNQESWAGEKQFFCKLVDQFGDILGFLLVIFSENNHSRLLITYVHIDYTLIGLFICVVV